MTVLKWLLVIFGVLFVAVLAVIIGGYYWASSVEGVKITAEDIKQLEEAQKGAADAK